MYNETDIDSKYFSELLLTLFPSIKKKSLLDLEKNSDKKGKFKKKSI